MEKKKNIIILGAGPAGLSAGWRLSEKGFQVKVIEKEQIVGGQCATVERDGFRFDLGGHRFISNDDELLNEIKTLMGDELITVSRKSKIRLFNKYFQYPLEIKDLVKGTNFFLSVRCLLDYLYSTVRKKLLHSTEDSFEDWVVNRFGYSLYSIFFRTYTKKLWGVSPKLISSDWAAQRFSLINLWDVLLRLIKRKRNIPKTYALKFLYPKLGIGRISEKFSEKIRENGGEIICNADVKQVVTEGNAIKKIIYGTEGMLKEISGDSYINTMPLTEFVQKFHPTVEKKYIDASTRMKFRCVRFMNIIFDIERISENTWIYVPESQYIFFRIQETRNWSQYLIPEKNMTALILEIACFENDEIWKKDEEDLFNICLKDLKKLGFINDKIKAVKYSSTRLKHAYPIYDLKYQEKLDLCIEAVERIENMVSIGRQGLFRYNNMDHSIKMGLFTAEQIKRGVSEAEIFSINSKKKAFEIEKDKKDRE